MSKNIIPETPEEALLTKIANLQRQIEAFKYQQPLSVYRTEQTTVDITIASGAIAVIDTSLTPPEGQKSFAIPEVAIYQYIGGIYERYLDVMASPANLEAYGFINEALSDGENIYYTLVIKNAGVSSIDLRVVTRWRYTQTGTV